jgi:hypothetical protein
MSRELRGIVGNAGLLDGRKKTITIKIWSLGLTIYHINTK